MALKYPEGYIHLNKNLLSMYKTTLCFRLIMFMEIFSNSCISLMADRYLPWKLYCLKPSFSDHLTYSIPVYINGLVINLYYTSVYLFDNVNVKHVFSFKMVVLNEYSLRFLHDLALITAVVVVKTRYSQCMSYVSNKSSTPLLLCFVTFSDFITKI